MTKQFKEIKFGNKIEYNPKAKGYRYSYTCEIMI